MSRPLITLVFQFPILTMAQIEYLNRHPILSVKFDRLKELAVIAENNLDPNLVSEQQANQWYQKNRNLSAEFDKLKNELLAAV